LIDLAGMGWNWEVFDDKNSGKPLGKIVNFSIKFHHKLLKNSITYNQSTKFHHNLAINFTIFTIKGRRSAFTNFQKNYPFPVSKSQIKIKLSISKNSQ
jgi:hypothetical protein